MQTYPQMTAFAAVSTFQVSGKGHRKTTIKEGDQLVLTTSQTTQTQNQLYHLDRPKRATIGSGWAFNPDQLSQFFKQL